MDPTAERDRAVHSTAHLALLREAVGILLEGTPAGIDSEKVRTAVTAVPGVAGVRDLHLWAITTGVNAAN